MKGERNERGNEKEELDWEGREKVQREGERKAEGRKNREILR